MINETTNVPEPVFITQYLKKCIFELESIINIAEQSEGYSKDTKNELKKLYEEACEFVKTPYEDRTKVIEFRLYMKQKTLDILNG